MSSAKYKRDPGSAASRRVAPRSPARTGLALALANARYWTGVAPVVRAQLERWERRAQAIPDPALRTIALAKLHDERFNAEVAATLATLAPRAQRARTAEAIVALQLAYDYLDGLTEQPAPDPLRSGRQLSLAFTDALAGTDGGAGGRTSAQDDSPTGMNSHPRIPGDYSPGDSGDYFREHPSDDGGYLAALSAATSGAIAQLPAWSAVSQTALASAELCAEAQVRVHAASSTGTARLEADAARLEAGATQLEEWARAQAQAAATGLAWRELLAGAVSSVLAVHALIAAAANERTTPAQAAAIDRAYLSISALSTMLDSAIDHAEDCRDGDPWNVRHYDSPELLADALASVIGDARTRIRTLPNAAHHMLMLVGVAAYYTSARQADRGIAATVMGRVRDELGPSLGPTLTVMRAWRGAKTLRRGVERLRRPAGSNRRTAPLTRVSVDEVTATPEPR